MIVLVEAHAMIGLGPGNSPAPIPYFAYVVSDEGSISRFATSIPDLLDKAKLDLEGKKWNNQSLELHFKKTLAAA